MYGMSLISLSSTFSYLGPHPHLQLPVRRRPAEPLVRGHGGPLRPPGQAGPDHGAPGRVRHQEHWEGELGQHFSGFFFVFIMLVLLHFKNIPRKQFYSPPKKSEMKRRICTAYTRAVRNHHIFKSPPSSYFSEPCLSWRKFFFRCCTSQRNQAKLYRE